MPGMGDANIPQRSHLHRQDVLMPCDQADMGFGEMQSSLQFVYGQHTAAHDELTLVTKQWRAAVESAAVCCTGAHLDAMHVHTKPHELHTCKVCYVQTRSVPVVTLPSDCIFLGKCKCCVLVLATVLVCCPHPVHKHSWFLANAYKRG